MDIKMRFDETRPIFVQLAEQLENAICRECTRRRTRSQSITEYSVAYGINPATALRGINLLVDAGCSTKSGGGPVRRPRSL